MKTQNTTKRQLTEVQWDTCGSTGEELTRLADEAAGWSDTAEEATKSFLEMAGQLTGAEAVCFFEVNLNL
tara:strand:- start:424 stop:633 length:210 start_codon:yes stop_codon:yes gene_type:complete